MSQKPTQVTEAPASADRRNDSTIRPYRSHDVTEAAQLYQAAFSGQRDPGDWAWKLERVLTEPNPPFFVAEAGGHLAGMYPTRALRLQVYGEICVGIQVQEVCIHPDYRGGAMLRGIFRCAEQAWRDAGVPFAFGFPTAEHMRVGIRILRYREMFQLQVWRLPLTRGLRLQARLRSERMRRLAYEAGALLSRLDGPTGPTGSNGVKVASLPRFDASADRLWEHVRTRIPCGVVRDAAYLNWRYVERPGRPFKLLGAVHDGRLDGYCVFRDDLARPDGWRAGAVFDLLAIDPVTAGGLLHTVLARMRAAHCAYALALTHPEFHVAPVLAAAGFMPEAEHTVIFCGKVYRPELEIETLQRPADWLLSYGDTDHLG